MVPILDFVHRFKIVPLNVILGFPLIYFSSEQI